jgi:hypothetical protein
MMERSRGVNDAPSQDRFAPECVIRKLLESYNVDVSGIPHGAFVLVWAQIDKFKYRPNDEIDGRPLRRPVTDRDMLEMKRRGFELREKRRALRSAAKILEAEIDDLRAAGLQEHVRRWAEAIAVLRMPRSVIDDPRHWLRGAKSGPPMRPWAYMATEIAGTLMGVLKAYGVPTPLRRTSAIPRFTLEALKFIGVEKLPAITTLEKVLQKNLAGIAET